MRPLSRCLAVFAASLITSSCAISQEIRRTPLPSDHPLIGSWKLDIPELKCFEVYTIKADGTASVTSGQEVGESEFEISLQPSEKGFYKWVDKITGFNGKPDCSGAIMEVGHVATNYIAIHESGRMMVFCQEENFDACFGPLVRQDDI